MSKKGKKSEEVFYFLFFFLTASDEGLNFLNLVFKSPFNNWVLHIKTAINHSYKGKHRRVRLEKKMIFLDLMSSNKGVSYVSKHRFKNKDI